MPDMSQAPDYVTVGGQQYAVHPLEEADLDDLDNWHRAQFVAQARKTLSPEMSQDERDEMLGAIQREAMKQTMLGAGIQKTRAGAHRIIRILWQSLRPRNVAYETFYALIHEHADDLKEALKTVGRINGWTLKVDKGKKDGDEPPKEPASG